MVFINSGLWSELVIIRRWKPISNIQLISITVHFSIPLNPDAHNSNPDVHNSNPDAHNSNPDAHNSSYNL